MAYENELFQERVVPPVSEVQTPPTNCYLSHKDVRLASDGTAAAGEGAGGKHVVTIDESLTESVK